jgi:hypothetical protein
MNLRVVREIRIRACTALNIMIEAQTRYDKALLFFPDDTVIG